MISNFSTPTKTPIGYLADPDSALPFSEYIENCRSLIKNRRADLQQTPIDAAHIINANSPYELYPPHPIYIKNKIKYGVLLIHGLFDSPFTFKEIGAQLQANGMLCRSVLLPGHGTCPKDLLTISYQDWIQTVKYGIESLRREVHQVILIGYSTGATLSIYHALQDADISGVVLLAPAIKIKAPVNVMVKWQKLFHHLRINKEWIYNDHEVDYVKYQSIAINPVIQIAKLTQTIDHLFLTHSLSCPVFMAVSNEDETISSYHAVKLFSRLSHPNSELLLYTVNERTQSDPRIMLRKTSYPELNIRHFSHVSLPYSPTNLHYGPQGDYIHASHVNSRDFIYGAYNAIEEKYYRLLHRLGLIKYPRRELTYNPDFDFMTKRIVQFILEK